MLQKNMIYANLYTIVWKALFFIRTKKRYFSWSYEYIILFEKIMKGWLH